MDIFLVWIWIWGVTKRWLMIVDRLILSLDLSLLSVGILDYSSFELICWSMHLLQVLLVDETLVRWMWNLLGWAWRKLLRHEIDRSEITINMGLAHHLLVVAWGHIWLVKVGKNLWQDWLCVVKWCLTFHHMRRLIHLLRASGLHLVNCIILACLRVWLVQITGSWVYTSTTTELLESTLVCFLCGSHEINLQIALLVVRTFSFVFVHILNCSFLEWITTV